MTAYFCRTDRRVTIASEVKGRPGAVAKASLKRALVVIVDLKLE